MKRMLGFVVVSIVIFVPVRGFAEEGTLDAAGEAATDAAGAAVSDTAADASAIGTMFTKDEFTSKIKSHHPDAPQERIDWMWNAYQQNPEKFLAALKAKRIREEYPDAPKQQVKRAIKHPRMGRAGRMRR